MSIIIEWNHLFYNIKSSLLLIIHTNILPSLLKAFRYSSFLKRKIRKPLGFKYVSYHLNQKSLNLFSLKIKINRVIFLIYMLFITYDKTPYIYRILYRCNINNIDKIKSLMYNYLFVVFFLYRSFYKSNNITISFSWVNKTYLGNIMSFISFISDTKQFLFHSYSKNSIIIFLSYIRIKIPLNL